MIALINKNSGGGTAVKKWKRVRSKVELNNSTEIVYFSVIESANEFVLNALNKGETEFVFAGGDGTINYFINHLINSIDRAILRKIKIGAVGIGSSNDFHKPYNSQNIFKKIPYKINFNNIMERDVGCIEFEKEGKLFKKYFLINASIGVTAEGNKFFNSPDSILRFLKKSNTESAITYAAIRNVFTYKNFLASIKINNESFEANVSNAGIIKCPFFSGKLRYKSSPLLNNGLFDVHLYQSLSIPMLIKLFYSLSNGASDNSFNKKFWRTDRIKISSEEEFAVEFDGEVITTKSADFSIIPGLIKVCIN